MKSIINFVFFAFTDRDQFFQNASRQFIQKFFVANNTEMQESINAAMEGSDVLVEVKDNEVIYTYDLSKMDGYTEELIKDEAVIASLDSTLTSIAPTFGGISKTLEEKTKIKGITTTVKYTWGDEEIITKSFNSADAAENTAE